MAEKRGGSQSDILDALRIAWNSGKPPHAYVQQRGDDLIAQERQPH